MKYKNYYNFELGNRDIYSHNDILGMTVQDLFDNELPLSYQYNTIGIPKDEDLTNSPNTHQYTNANGKLRWRSSSKTTEELLEEERQRRAEQEAQTANAQSHLAGFGENSISPGVTEPKQTLESPMLESEPLVDVNTMQNYKSILQNIKQNDNVVSPVLNAIRLKALPQYSSMEEPDYYEENMPVYQEEELWSDLKDYLKPDLVPQTKYDDILMNEQAEDLLIDNNGKALIKGFVEEVVNPYDLIQNDISLSTEEKIAKIKELTELRNKDINKEYNKNMARIWTGGALEVGSYFIPETIGAKAVGGLTKAMAPIAKKLLPKMGKKVANDIVKNVAEGAVSAPIGAIGESMVMGEGTDEFLPKVGKGMMQNTMFSANIWEKKQQRAAELKKIDNFDSLSKYQKRRMQDKYMQYYDDYVDATVKYKTPKPRPSHQLRDKEWLEWLKKAKLRKL